MMAAFLIVFASIHCPLVQFPEQAHTCMYVDSWLVDSWLVDGEMSSITSSCNVPTVIMQFAQHVIS